MNRTGPPTALAALLLLVATTARADDPDARRRVPEALEMFWSILKQGADMGPGQAWFHPAESRYGWSWLAGKDRDGDGRVTAQELGGPDDLFARLDRDKDGAITEEDTDWTGRAAYFRQAGMARQRFVMMDHNSNGRVSKEEWDAFFEQAAQGKDGLTAEDIAEAFYSPPPRPSGPPPASEMPTRLTLLKGLFSGEIGSPFEGPHPGDTAPDFTLTTHDNARTISLSDLRGKPVVLIFGSFT